MKRFNKIIISCDLTPMDKYLIHAVHLLQKVLEPQEVYLLHVSKEMSAFTEFSKQYDQVVAEMEKSIREDMMLMIDQEFGGEGFPYKVRIRTGNTAEEILKFRKEIDADLIVMGAKKESKGGGHVCRQVESFTNSSVLIYPEIMGQQVREIVVPVDFSAHCQYAMETALMLGKAFGIKVQGVHLYQVPVGYRYSEMTYDDFANMVLESRQKQYHEFMEDLDTEGVDYNFSFIKKKHTEELGDKIFELAQQTEGAMLLMSSQGRTRASAFFFGSNAFKVLNHRHIHVPLLIVKDKARQMDVMDMIKKALD